MLDCRHILAGLSDYLDDEVVAALRRDIESHLAHCRTCSAVYDSTRRTLRIVTEARTFEIPEGVADRVMKRIRDQIGGA